MASSRFRLVALGFLALLQLCECDVSRQALNTNILSGAQSKVVMRHREPGKFVDAAKKVPQYDMMQVEPVDVHQEGKQRQPVAASDDEGLEGAFDRMASKHEPENRRAEHQEKTLEQLRADLQQHIDVYLAGLHMRRNGRTPTKRQGMMLSRPGKRSYGLRLDALRRHQQSANNPQQAYEARQQQRYYGMIRNTPSEEEHFSLTPEWASKVRVEHRCSNCAGDTSKTIADNVGAADRAEAEKTWSNTKRPKRSIRRTVENVGGSKMQTMNLKRRPKPLDKQAYGMWHMVRVRRRGPPPMKVRSRKWSGLIRIVSPKLRLSETAVVHHNSCEKKRGEHSDTGMWHMVRIRRQTKPVGDTDDTSGTKMYGKMRGSRDNPTMLSRKSADEKSTLVWRMIRLRRHAPPIQKPTAGAWGPISHLMDPKINLRMLHAAQNAASKRKIGDHTTAWHMVRIRRGTSPMSNKLKAFVKDLNAKSYHKTKSRGVKLGHQKRQAGDGTWHMMRIRRRPRRNAMYPHSTWRNLVRFAGPEMYGNLHHVRQLLPFRKREGSETGTWHMIRIRRDPY